MDRNTEIVPFNEFSSNLTGFFDQIIQDNTAVVVENDKGERVLVKPVGKRKARGRTKTEADRQAFLSALGGWADLDLDLFLNANAVSRKASSRPPVEL